MSTKVMVVPALTEVVAGLKLEPDDAPCGMVIVVPLPEPELLDWPDELEDVAEEDGAEVELDAP